MKSKLLIQGCVVSTSYGVIIMDTVGLSAAQAYGAQFDAVAGIGTNVNSTFNAIWASSVLIDQYTVLTASHVDPVVGETLFFGADGDNPTHTRTISGVLDFFSGGTTASGGPSYGDGSDLALVFFDTPITDITPYALTFDNIVGQEFTMVGYGDAGVGSTGVSSSFHSQRYAGTNTIDLMTSHTYGDRYWADFDSGLASDNELGSVTPTSQEAIIGSGDSGGPLLINHNGSWVVAGITNAGINQSGENDGEYGEQSIWTGLSEIEDEIRAYTDATIVSLVPEPSSAGLLGLSGLALLMRRKR